MEYFLAVSLPRRTPELSTSPYAKLLLFMRNIMESPWFPSNTTPTLPKRQLFFLVSLPTDWSIISVALLPKLVGETSYMEFAPGAPRSLQRTAHGLMIERVDPSSVPEVVFIEILATFKDLPGFRQRLSTVNEYRQSMLHLAVHLRYRELVQTLVDWGIDLNIKDVNGSTALHAAYLCGDVTITHILQQHGATQLSLDELGRPPVELASWFMKNPKGH